MAVEETFHGNAGINSLHRFFCVDDSKSDAGKFGDKFILLQPDRTDNSG